MSAISTDRSCGNWRKSLKLPSAGLHKVERGPDQLEVLLVVGRIRSVDLDPLPRGSRADATGLKRNHVIPRELQLGHPRDRQAQRQALAVDAGEHPVGYEIGVE